MQYALRTLVTIMSLTELFYKETSRITWTVSLLCLRPTVWSVILSLLKCYLLSAHQSFVALHKLFRVSTLNNSCSVNLQSLNLAMALFSCQQWLFIISYFFLAMPYLHNCRFWKYNHFCIAAISRRKIEMSVDKVISAINALDLKQVSLENVELLQRMVPTDQEVMVTLFLIMISVKHIFKQHNTAWLHPPSTVDAR